MSLKNQLSYGLFRRPGRLMEVQVGPGVEQGSSAWWRDFWTVPRWKAVGLKVVGSLHTVSHRS